MRQGEDINLSSIVELLGARPPMLLRHSAIYFLSRGVPGIVGFAMVIIYTRLLSPEEYGKYALVVTGAVVCNAILYQWLCAALVRFIPQYRDNEVALLNTIFSGFLFASSLAAAIGALLAAIWYDSPWSQLILIGVLLVWAQAWFAINLDLVRSRIAPVRYGLISMLKAIIALAVGVLLISLGLSIYGALAGLIVGFFVGGVWSSWGQWKGSIGWRLNWQLAKKVLVYGLPLAASYSLAVIMSGSDRFMLALIINESATGLYAAGQSLAQQTVGVLMTMINLAAYPLILRTLESAGPAAARAQLRKNGILLLGIGMPVTTGIVVLAPEIGTVFLGDEFRAAGIELIPWFAIATLVASLRAYYFDLAFFLGKRTQTHMMMMGASAILNVALNFQLIPTYGLLGAAYSSIFVYVFAIVLSAIIGGKVFRMPVILGDFVGLAFATLTMAVILVMIPTNEGVIGLLWSIIVGGSIYFACLCAFNLCGVRTAVRNFLSEGRRAVN